MRNDRNAGLHGGGGRGRTATQRSAHAGPARRPEAGRRRARPPGDTRTHSAVRPDTGRCSSASGNAAAQRARPSRGERASARPRTRCSRGRPAPPPSPPTAEFSPPPRPPAVRPPCRCECVLGNRSSIQSRNSSEQKQARRARTQAGRRNIYARTVDPQFSSPHPPPPSPRACCLAPPARIGRPRQETHARVIGQRLSHITPLAPAARVADAPCGAPRASGGSWRARARAIDHDWPSPPLHTEWSRAASAKRTDDGRTTDGRRTATWPGRCGEDGSRDECIHTTEPERESPPRLQPARRDGPSVPSLLAMWPVCTAKLRSSHVCKYARAATPHPC